MNSVDHIHELDALLNKLQRSSDPAFIEYGDKEFKGGIMSAYRIRYIATGSGMQYAIKAYNCVRGEGSGMYFLDRVPMFVKLSELLTEYNREDDKIRSLMKKIQLSNHRETKLSFNFYEDDTPSYQQQMLEGKNLGGPLY